MPRCPSFFCRVVLSALLVSGFCLQPVFAASCDIEDARMVLDHGPGAPTISDADHSRDAGDCCANPACDDCCLHATASLPDATPTMIQVMPWIAVAALNSVFSGSSYPVDIRPPIAV